MDRLEVFRFTGGGGHGDTFLTEKGVYGGGFADVGVAY